MQPKEKEKEWKRRQLRTMHYVSLAESHIEQTDIWTSNTEAFLLTYRLVYNSNSHSSH